MNEERLAWVPKVAFLVSLLVSWEIVHAYGGFPAYLLPSPLHVTRELLSGIATGAVVGAVWVSMRRAVLGFALALLLGVGLGFAMAESRSFGQLVRPYVSGLQSLPSICWFPLVILWMGLGEGAVTAITVVGAMFAIAMAVTSGLRQIPPDFLRAAATMGARGFDRFRWVLLPALMPSLVTGARQGWSFAWRSLMAAELLAHNGGVGYLLMRARELNNVAQVMGVILLILLMGAVMEQLIFARVERHLRNVWGLQGSGG